MSNKIYEINKAVLDAAKVSEEQRKKAEKIVLVLTPNNPIEIHTGEVDISKLTNGLNKLNINKCIKCGSKEHTMRYIWDDIRESMGTLEEVVVSENDYLQVECSTCGYSWGEEVLEKEERVDL